MKGLKILLLLFISSISFSQEYFNLIDHGFTKEIEIVVERPRVEEVELQGRKYSIVIPGSTENMALLPNFLPFYNFLLSATPNAKVEFLQYDVEEINLNFPLFETKERSLPDSAEFNDVLFSVEKPYDFIYLGKMRGVDVFSLLVFPFRVEGQKLIYVKKIKLNVIAGSLAKVETREIFAEPRINNFSFNLSVQQTQSEFEYKIFITKDGVYKLTYEDLKSAGIDLKGVQASKLRIRNNGVEIPIYVYSGGDGIFNEGDYIEFYAERRKNKFADGKSDLYNDPFTDVNVYFLEVSDVNGLRLAEESGVRVFENFIDLRGASFYSEIHFENDLIFERFGNSDVNLTYDVRDHWFWANLSSNQQVDFDVYIPAPDLLSLDNLKIRAAFHGIASVRQPNPRNIAYVFVNNTRILTTEWSGENINIASSEFSGYPAPNSLLKDGGNKISVFNANDGRIENTIFAVNWIELTYRRLYQASGDEIKFKIPPEYTGGYFRFELYGFKNPNISIYRIGTSRISNVEIIKAKDEKIGENYHAIFYANVLSPDVEFIAVSENAKLKPDSIAKDLKTNLKSSSNAFDYLIITHPLLYDKQKEIDDQTHPLNQLKSLYESKGLTVKIISVDDIYDEFNHGVKSPYAIKDFLRYAYFNWAKSPTYVLFAGGAVYDNPRFPELDLIPTMFYQSYVFGAVSADAWFTFIDGEDYLGDILLGRLPVRDRDELKNTVEKIISYWNQKPQLWNRNVLMIAGDGREFESQTDFLVKNVLPSYLNINRLYVIAGSIFSGGTSKLLSFINDGQLLVNFVGHGGGAIWSDNGLFKNEDIRKLANKDRYPFITSMTCFTGAFDSPQKTAIGANLVVEKEKGAIGVLASSGLGWLLNDYFMLLSVFPYVFDQNKTVGEIITLGKARYYSNYFFWPQAKTMVYQYNYIGDPAIRLLAPDGKSIVQSEKKVLSLNDTLKVQIQSQVQTGTASVLITDDEHIPKHEFTVNIQSGRASFSIKPPVASGFVKVFVSDGQRAEVGSSSFKTGGSFIGDYLISPENPKPGDSLTFSGRVEIENDATPDSVKFLVYRYKSELGRFDRLIGYDTLICNRSGANFYSSSKILAEAGVRYLFQMFAYYDGRRFNGDFREVIIGGLPDPSFVPPELNRLQSSIYAKSQNVKFIADSVVKVKMTVYNLSDIDANNFKVKIYDSLRSEGYFIGEMRFSIDANSKADIEVPLQKTLNLGLHRIHAVIESDSISGDDFDYLNNWVYNELVYDFVKFASDSVAISDNVSLKRTSPFVSVIRFEYPVSSRISMPATNSLNFLRALGDSWIFLARYEAFNDGDAVEIFVKLDLSQGDSNQNRGRVKLYFYDERLKTFRIKNGDIIGEWFYGRLDESGIYAIGYSNDSKAPFIEVTVEGQSFRDGGIIPANPVFSILIEDDEGVDISKGSFRFKIDGRDIPYSEIIIPDTIKSPKSLFVKLNPKLMDGEHWASFSARDVNGNWSNEVRVSFKVQSNFEIKLFGNFPNPFSEKTFFAYEILGSPVEEVEFRIYTVSGRLIQSFKFPSSNPVEIYGFQVGGTGIPTSIGYHEIWWDGTDKDGNEVANGVYFYKFSVKYQGKVKSYTGKIARIR